MFKRLAVSSLITLSILNAREIQYPTVVDFGKVPQFYNCYHNTEPNSWTWDLGRHAFQLGMSAFNDAPELGSFFASIKDAYKIDIVVETGTHMASTAAFFSTCFGEVHTIELVESFNSRAKEIFKLSPHVHCHLGSSEKVLKQLLPTLKGKRVLFYLDAHWEQFWPLLDEIEEIAKTHKNNCIIAIDDFKVPGRPDIDFDRYDMHECSIEYVKEKLEKVLPEYTAHYLIPKRISARAKFVAIPKKWAKE